MKLPDGQEQKTDGFLFRFFKKLYAPFILKEWVRPVVVSPPPRRAPRDATPPPLFISRNTDTQFVFMSSPMADTDFLEPIFGADSAFAPQLTS